MTAVEPIVSSAADEDIAAVFPEELVVARASHEPVVGGRAGERVVPCRACDRAGSYSPGSDEKRQADDCRDHDALRSSESDFLHG